MGEVGEYHWEHLKPLLDSRYPGSAVPQFDSGSPVINEGAIKMCRVLLEKLDILELQESDRNAGVEVKDPGAVLIFLPGIEEIKKVSRVYLEYYNIPFLNLAILCF